MTRFAECSPKALAAGFVAAKKLRKVRSRTRGLRRGAYAVFHHVDAWPAVDLRTGKRFSLR